MRSGTSRALQGTCGGACDISGCCGQHLRLCCGYIRAASRHVWVLSFGGGGRFGYDELSLSFFGRSSGEEIATFDLHSKPATWKIN